MTITAPDALSIPEPELPPPDLEAPKPKGRRAAPAWVPDFRDYLDLRRTPYGLKPLLIFSFVIFAQVIDTTAFSLAGPEFIRLANINIKTIVNIGSFVGFISLFAALGVGWYADRHKRVPLFAIGTMISGVGAIAQAGATSAVTLGVPRVLDDTANVAANVPSFSLLADYYPLEARGRVFAFLGTASRLATLLAFPVIGILVATVGLRPAFIVFGVPILLAGLVALFQMREPVRGYFERQAFGLGEDDARVEEEPQSFGEGWRTVFAVRTLRRLFFANIVTSGLDASNVFFSFLLFEKYGLSITGRIYLSIPAVIAGLIGGLIGGRLLDKFAIAKPARVLTVVGAFRIVAVIGLIGYALQPPIIVIAVFSALVAFGGALIGPASASVFSQVVPPSVRTQGLQITDLSEVPRLLIFQTIFAAVFAAHGYTTVFLLGVPFGIIGAIMAASAGASFDIDRRNALAAAAASVEFKRARDDGKGKLLVCRGVDVGYNGVQVLFDVDFDVDDGEIIALLGTNGAGKSTLLRAISGSQEASGGAIVFDGRDTTHMPPHETAQRGIVFMPGGRGVFPGLSVRENLLLGNWMNDDEESIRAGLAEVFEIFPRLAERIDVNAGLLSGGEQQQVSLAQAFLAKPRLLMIDELSLGLSPAVVGQLLEIVREIHRRGVTIIVVEQSVNVALNLAEKAIFMEKGEIKFFGQTKDLLARPDILRAVYVKGTGSLTEGAAAAAERDRRRLEQGESRPVLELHGLVKRYGGVTAVGGVDLVLREGEVLGLIGPNGSGKTTLFELISGYQVPDEGTVIHNGVDITRMTPEERARRKLIRRFQDARLFPSLTVYETLLCALDQKLQVRSAALGAAGLPSSRRSERQVRARADKLIELLDLESFTDKFVKELSTGLRRIVDLACVLATEPEVLLLDEPSSGIAQAEAEGLGPLLKRIRFETGCSILIIEHDMPLISSVSDELIALERGMVVTRGLPDVVLNDERVISAYLGGSIEAINRSGSVK